MYLYTYNKLMSIFMVINIHVTLLLMYIMKKKKENSQEMEIRIWRNMLI